jgi:hypothetical protein
LDGDVAEEVRHALNSKQLPDEPVSPVFDDQGNVLHWLNKDGAKVNPEDPLWVHEKPVRFNRMIREQFSRTIARAFESQGYFHARFTYELDCDDTTADLVVRVQDIGVVAVVREIELVGNEQNSREEIIDFLNLHIGKRMSTAEKHRILRLLRNSARFTKQHVKVEKADARGGVKLLITLNELPVAPRLSEPFSREDLAMLKLHQWITRGGGRGLDRIYQIQDENTVLDFIVSPSCGIVAFIRIRSDENSDFAVSHGFVASDDHTAFYNLRENRSLVLPSGHLKLSLTVGLAISDDPDPLYRINFKFGIAGQKSGDDAPTVKLKTTMDPVYFLGLSRLRDPLYAWDGDQLTVQTSWGSLKVDSTTGQLLARSFSSDGYGGGQVEYREGAFDEAVAQLQASASGFQDEYDAVRPISSTVKYSWSFLTILAALNPDVESLQNAIEPNSVAAVEKLLDLGLLSVLDEAWNSRSKSKDRDTFSIPPSKPFSMSQDGIGRIAASLTNVIFSQDTWPADLWRETALVFAGHREYASLQLNEVVGDDSLGPIGHLWLAELLRVLSSPAASAIAQRGLRRGDQDDFVRDAALLLTNFRGKFDAPVRVICSLADDEVTALGRIVSDDPEQFVRVVQLLRQNRTDDVDGTILFALGQLWSNEWRQQTFERLEQIINKQNPARVASERPAPKASR